jgi:hypothetical protein
LGLELSVSTLADQVKWCTDLLRPLWRAALATVIDARVMHLDGTSLPMLDASAPGGKRLGALWGYVGVNADETTAAYHYVSTGKKTGQPEYEMGPEDMLGLREGLTIADASNLFDASFQRATLIECGCNMHAQRYFVKALDAGDQRAALPLAAYKKLYEIEVEIRDRDPDVKLAERRARSKPVWDELVAWCEVRKTVRAAVVGTRQGTPVPHQPQCRARPLSQVRLRAARQRHRRAPARPRGAHA